MVRLRSGKKSYCHFILAVREKPSQECRAERISTYMPTRSQTIIALRQKGLTRRQIAARLGISKNLVGVYVHYLLQKNIMEPISLKEADRRRPRKSANVDVAEARCLRQAGISYKEIGKRYGVPGPTISKLIGSTVRITPIQQRLIRLHRQGLSYNAIAAKVGKPEGTVAVLLSRLVKKGLLPPRREKPEDRSVVRKQADFKEEQCDASSSALPTPSWQSCNSSRSGPHQSRDGQAVQRLQA